MGLKCEENIKKMVKTYENENKADIIKYTRKLMKIVKKYIESNDLIVYGGVALNEMLPKSKKIYDSTTLKDYDCYCVNNKLHGKKLVDILINEGYKYVESKKGFSVDTIKVFVEFISVCDFTEISKEQFEFYQSMCIRKNGMNVVSLSIIKSSLSMELSQPNLSYYRWEKLFPRFRLVLEEFKEKNIKVEKRVVNDNVALYERLLETIKKNRLPLGGLLGYKLHKNESIYPLYKYGEKMAVISVLCKSSSLYKLEDCLKGSKIKTYDNKDGTFSYYDKNGVFIMDVYLADDRCVAVCKKKGYMVLSIIGIMNQLYEDLIEYYNDEKDDITKMIYLVERLILKYKCDNSCYIGLECYGDFRSIFRLKKERWNDLALNYRPKRQNKNKSIFV